MKSPSVKLVLITLSIIIIAACDPVEPDKKAALIMPLAVGNYWIWESTEYDSVGNIVSQEPETLLVRNVYNRDGLVYYGLVGDTTVIKNWADVCYMNDEAGLHMVTFYQFIENGNMRDSIAKTLYVKYPVYAGDSYKVNYGISTDSVYVESDFIQLDMDFGLTTCIWYKFIHKTTDGIQERNYYYAPGIGRVCEKIYIVPEKGLRYLSSSMELKKYKAD